MIMDYDGSLDKKTFKDVIGNTIMQLVDQDPDVVYLDADLMTCLGTTQWSKTTDRAINCGIAEANMAGIASGLSAGGFKPIIHTFGVFASRRIYDQIFLSGGYAGNSVTVIGTDPGVVAALNGGTHMPFEDIALYRAMPNCKVFDISDVNMMQDVLVQCVDLPGIKYIRVPRKNAVKIYQDGARFELGKACVLKPGTDVAIVASGIMVAKALLAAKILEKEGVNAAVIDCYTIKPLDMELITELAKICGAFVTCENHNKIGGLTSAVAEVLTSQCPVPQEYVAVEDVFGEVGPQDYLEERFGLTVEHIVEKALKAISRKGV